MVPMEKVVPMEMGQEVKSIQLQMVMVKKETIKPVSALCSAWQPLRSAWSRWPSESVRFDSFLPAAKVRNSSN